MRRWLCTALALIAVGPFPASAQEIGASRTPNNIAGHPPISQPPPRPKPLPSPSAPGNNAPQKPLHTTTVSWIGFYVGGSLALSTDTVQQTAFDRTAATWLTSSVPSSGVLAGTFVGTVTQSGAFVVGVEADVDGRLLRRDAAMQAVVAMPVLSAASDNWRASIRGRAGYAFDRVLIYVTAGGAVSNWTIHQSAPIGAQDSADFTRLGWTLGFGVEYAVGPNWTTRFEYRHSDFGSAEYAPLATPSVTVSDRLRDNMVRGGISYRFDWSEQQQAGRR